jgi:hypothetical protein
LGVAFHGGIITYAFNMSGYFDFKCGNNGNSFVSNLKESLQTKGIPTEVEGHKGYVGMNDEGVLMEGDQVPEDRRMMEKGDTGDTAEQEKIDLEAEGIRLKKEQEKAELAEGIRLKKEQEKAELEAEGTRLKNEEEKIRNEHIILLSSGTLSPSINTPSSFIPTYPL